MRQHFPYARETRNWDRGQDRWAYSHIFSEVARRYFYLRSCRARLIEKINIGSWTHHLNQFWKVAPWDLWLSVDSRPRVFQYIDPSWCLDDGLLVYPETEPSRFVIYDLVTHYRFPVPFYVGDKIVRRVRLAHRTLVIEWCERAAFYLSRSTVIHQHFATALNVQRVTSDLYSWEIRFRCQWKIHDVGIPLDFNSRFFSAHTATHYALYMWEPNGMPESQQHPIEQITIWDIGGSSPCHSSGNPRGVRRPVTSHSPAKVIRKFANRDLDFLGIRQGHEPKLREILIDEANIYIHEENLHQTDDPQAAPNFGGPHIVRSTGIPFSGVGPLWRARCRRNFDFPALPVLPAFPRAMSTGRLGGYSGMSVRLDGKIVGDERWLVGQQGITTITILRF
jgi:hypothetical protein